MLTGDGMQDDDYPVTAQSIAAARRAQAIERAQVMWSCDVVFDEVGKIYWMTEQIEKRPGGEAPGPHTRRA